MDRNYNLMEEIPPLRKYAYIGSRIEFMRKLKYLASQAEQESWYYDHPSYSPEEKEYAVLYSYILHTFSKAYDENKLYETETHSIFNTGLLTKMGQELYMLFERNTRYVTDPENNPKWYFKIFVIPSSHEIPSEMRAHLPEHVDYFESCPSDLYFDTKLKITSNLYHVLIDNRERLPDGAQTFPDEVLLQIVEAAESQMKKRILRNNRLVVPQYYNKKIMYLAPLMIGKEIVPVAIERNGDTYRINTVLTPGMAYCNARLIMKPESNWLTNK